MEHCYCRSLEAIAGRLEDCYCSRLEAIAGRLEHCYCSRLEAIAGRLEAIVSRLGAISIRLCFMFRFLRPLSCILVEAPSYQVLTKQTVRLILMHVKAGCRKLKASKRKKRRNKHREHVNVKLSKKTSWTYSNSPFLGDKCEDSYESHRQPC